MPTSTGASSTKGSGRRRRTTHRVGVLPRDLGPAYAFVVNVCWYGPYSAYPMRHVKNAAVAILRLLGAAVLLAFIVLLVEVVAGVLLVEIDPLVN